MRSKPLLLRLCRRFRHDDWGCLQRKQLDIPLLQGHSVWFPVQLTLSHSLAYKQSDKDWVLSNVGAAAIKIRKVFYHFVDFTLKSRSFLKRTDGLVLIRNTLGSPIDVGYQISAWGLTHFLVCYIKLQDFSDYWPIFASK